MQQTKQTKLKSNLQFLQLYQKWTLLFFFLGSDDFLTLPDKTHVALKYSF
jgi:hypothetical protein